MLELCMSGKAWRIFLRSSLAHTMKAFMGLLMWLLFRDSEKWREPGEQVGESQAGNSSGADRAILCITTRRH